MNKVELISAFCARREKDCYIPFHSHNYYELVYYVRGRGVTNVEGKGYDFSSGDFLLVAPRTEHDDRHYEDGELYCIGFTVNETMNNHFFTDEEQAVERMVRTIWEESLYQQAGYEKMIEAKLNELLVVCSRMLSTQSPKIYARSFQYIINYLAENSHEKILLKDLARQMNFSYDYFQHQFKKLVGMSPQQFLVRKRIEMADILLQENQLNCTEIAYRCGFSNSAQFSSIYKREKGMKPTDVRKETTRKQNIFS